MVRSLQNEAEPDGATNPRSTADRQPGREGAEEETHGKNHLRTSARPDLKRWGHRGGSRKVICLACSEGRNRASFSLFIYHLGSTRPQHRGGPSRRRQQAAWHTHADIIGRAKVAPTPINVCTVCWRAPRFYPLPAKMRLCDPIQLCRIAVALPAPSDRVLPLPCFDKRREEKIYLIYHIYLF